MHLLTGKICEHTVIQFFGNRCGLIFCHGQTVLNKCQLICANLLSCFGLINAEVHSLLLFYNVIRNKTLQDVLALGNNQYQDGVIQPNPKQSYCYHANVIIQ